MTDLHCPRCQAVNPDTSRYCGACASPLLPGDGATPRPASGGAPASGSALSGPPPSRPSGLPSDSPSLTTTIDPVARGFQAGSVVAGKYRILGEIGRGGMGVVYEADDVKLRRAVALKFLPAELTDDAEARGRFVHEAQAASVLDNAHICTIHEIGESEDGRMFIAMALCHGESLRAKIKRGPLAPAEALSYAAQVADGLAAAHAAGIVHRDVKPANILVSKDGSARVADFGLAKIAGEARLTREGRAVGTVAYMSPEQLRGEDVDVRTDVWSLGVVLYEMLTGALPFHGTTEHSLAYAIVNSEPKPLSDLPAGTPEGCIQILERALAKDPAERFASAGEMADAIADVRAEAGFTGVVRSASRAARPAVRRSALVRKVLPVLAVGAVIGLAFLFRIPRWAAERLGLASPPSRAVTIFTPTVLGEDPDGGLLGAGLAEYLRRRLDEIARFSRSWITPGYDLDDYEVREASEAHDILGSNLVVTGTLKRSGDNLTLTLDVMDPVRFRRLAAVPVTDHIANIATWQDDLVRKAAAAIGLTLPAALSPAASPIDFARTTHPGAFEAYLRGLGSLAAYPATIETLSSAVAYFEDAVRLDPSFAAASADLAAALREKAAPAKDRSLLDRAEAVARALVSSNSAYPRGHYVLGLILRSLGRPAEAIPELERAVALDPLSYDALTRLARLYEDSGEPAKAQAAFRSAQAARPGYWAADSYLGLSYFYQGDYARARDVFERATRSCPANITVLNYLGATEFKLGAFERAIATFERSNQIRRSGDVLSNLAVLYYFSGRYADSVSAGESAAAYPERDTTNQIWGNLADAYRFTPGNEGKAAAAYAKAIALTEKALAGDPTDVRQKARLSTYLAKSGQTARALEGIEAILQAKPTDPDLYLYAVVVYEVSGDRSRALEALREYVKLKGPMAEITYDPVLAGLRQDPDYAKTIAGGPAPRAGEAR